MSNSKPRDWYTQSGGKLFNQMHTDDVEGARWGQSGVCVCYLKRTCMHMRTYVIDADDVDGMHACIHTYINGVDDVDGAH